MKKIKRILLTTSLSCIIAGCAIFHSGSNFQTVAGKFLETTAVTVDSAMKGWAIWVATGKATDADQATVKTYYVQYQVYMETATNLYTVAIKTGDTTLFLQASNNLQAASTKLSTVTSTPNTK